MKRWIAKSLGLAISILSLSLESRELHADLSVRGEKEKIFIRSDSDNLKELTIIKDGESIISTLTAIPYDTPGKKNYNHLDLEISPITPESITLIDVQGEMHSIFSKNDKSKDTLLFRTIESDNSISNFNIIYELLDGTQDIVFKSLYLNYNNQYCDRSLISTYKIKNAAIEKNLKDFNGRNTLSYLSKLKIEINKGRIDIEKAIPTDVNDIYRESISAYRAGKSRNFGKTVKRLIADGGEYESCSPESYIVERYYYPQNLRLSNDIGFLLEEAGYFKEASTLLKAVIKENPGRTVAHLNLADSYWGMGMKDSARASYQDYYHRMIESGQESRVPKRVIERKD